MVEDKSPVEIVDWNYDPFEDRRQKQVKTIKRKKRKRKILFHRIFAILFMFVGLVMLYYFSDVSKVRSVSVRGNHFFTDKEVMEMAGIDYNSRFWFTGNWIASNKLCDNPLIAKANIRHLTNHTLEIELIEQECLGYYWASDGKSYIVLRDGKRIAVATEYYACFSRMPYIRSEKDVDRVVSSFQNVKIEIITNISEIWTYVTTYDNQMFRVLMDDGNQMFGSEDSMILLNNYYGIMENLKNKKNYCLMFDQSSSTAYTKACEEFNDDEKKAIELSIQSSMNQDGSENDQENTENAESTS